MVNLRFTFECSWRLRRRGTLPRYLRLQDEDMPVLLAQFAKALLGEAAVATPLAELRERLATLQARGRLGCGSRGLWESHFFRLMRGRVDHIRWLWESHCTLRVCA